MRKPVFKKADAAKVINDIATAIAEAFNVPKPEVTDMRDKFPDWPEPWELRIGDETAVAVWTKAGPARMSVSIDRDFAHMFFKFHDPKAAIGIAHGYDRLNRHSGKWNDHETPSGGELRFWLESLKHDFTNVAEPNPDPAAVAAYEAAQKIEAEYWAACRAEFAAQRATAS